MTTAQMDVIRELRNEGYAVIVWTPEELGDASAGRVQDSSIETGYQIIENLQ